MGYGSYAARVRDETLPHDRRRGALGACLQMTRSLDHDTRWDYLVLRFGRPRLDPEFPLLAALAALDDERRLRALAEAEYAAHRRAQKRTGARHRRLTEVTPSSPRRWFGDEVRAARLVLATGTAVDERYAADVDPAAVAASAELLATGPITDPARLADLQALLVDRRRHRQVLDPTLLVLEQVHLATYGGLAMAVDWGFTPTGAL